MHCIHVLPKVDTRYVSGFIYYTHKLKHLVSYEAAGTNQMPTVDVLRGKGTLLSQTVINSELLV